MAMSPRRLEATLFTKGAEGATKTLKCHICINDNSADSLHQINYLDTSGNRERVVVEHFNKLRGLGKKSVTFWRKISKDERSDNVGEGQKPL